MVEFLLQRAIWKPPCWASGPHRLDFKFLLCIPPHPHPPASFLYILWFPSLGRVALVSKSALLGVLLHPLVVLTFCCMEQFLTQVSLECGFENLANFKEIRQSFPRDGIYNTEFDL